MGISTPIRSMSFLNYRCLPDGVIGPFAGFNLIYGRNGSGKTSLAEAIQLCLTGWLFRPHTDEKTKNIVERVSDLPVILKCFGPKGEISGYENGTVTPNRSVVLKTLYDIEALGPKARHLLDQMFRTHNILYSDQIVEFLKADSADKLCEVLRELMLGREVLEIWDRIITAKKTIKDICDNLEQKCSDVVAEVEDLTNNLKELDSRSSASTEALALELVRIMPPGLLEQVEPTHVELDQKTVTSLREAILRIEEAIRHSDGIRSILASGDVCENWDEVASRLREAKAVQTRANQKAREAETRQKGLRDEINSTQESLRDLEPEYEQLFIYVDKTDKCLGLLDHILVWISELQADFKGARLIVSILKFESKLSKLEQAKTMLGQLPDTSEIKRLHEGLFRLCENKKELEEKIVAGQKNREAADKQLQEIKTQTAAADSERQRTFDLLFRLHESVKEFCQIKEDSVCPSCGTLWPSIQELHSAVEKRYEALRSQLSPRDDVHPEYSDALARLRNQVATLETEQASNQKAIEKLDEEAVSIEARLRNVKVTLKQLQEILDQAGGQISAFDYDDPTEQAGYLDSEAVETAISETRDSIAQEKAKLEALWSGLRKDQWQTERDSLLAEINSLRNLLPEEIKVPEGFSHGEWSSLLSEIKQKKQISMVRRTQMESQIVPIKSMRSSLERAIQETEHSLSETREFERNAKNEVARWSEGVEHVRVLAELGFIKQSDRVNLAKLTDRLADLDRKAKALLAEIEAQLSAQRERSLITNQIEKKKEKRTGIEEELKTANEMAQTFSRMTPVEVFEQEIWAEYSENISKLFTKLHWPPDFSEVSLRHEGNVSSLMVRLREDGSECSAEQRLSSGQRAALAISVFWAINGRSENIPSFIMMDEPVQNVDDLNILNFLDSLRWLVEIGKRQVFLTTANRRIAGLIRRKFSYLGEDFKEIELTRDIGVSKINFPPPDGERIGQLDRASASQ